MIQLPKPLRDVVMDATNLQLRLKVDNKSVVPKAQELLRISDTKCPMGTLKQGELARQAICFELACNMLSANVSHSAIVLHSGVKETVYNKSLGLMSKLLGIKAKVTAKDLCVQFGCVRLEQATQQTLVLYKERYLKSLPPSQRAAADFSRPSFVAAAFFLTTKKAKVRVDKTALLNRLNLAATDFNSVSTSMEQLCFDTVGTATKKRKASSVKTNRELLDKQQGFNEASSDSSIDDGSDGEGAVHRSETQITRRQKRKDYDEWKQRILESEPKADKTSPLKALKQATLSFGR